MIVLDHPQGSQEWVDARLGIPTSSNFHRIVTPKTMRVSAAAATYRNKLLAEWMLGHSLDEAVSDFMQRGLELEQQAVTAYQLLRDVEVERVGLVLSDDRTTGCSPDGLVGKQGGLEIKTPTAENHVAHLLEMPITYRCQVQGALWITDREWWDLFSFNPYMPPALVRVNRDEEFIAKLAQAVKNFCEDLELAKHHLKEMGCLGHDESDT